MVACAPNHCTMCNHHCLFWPLDVQNKIWYICGNDMHFSNEDWVYVNDIHFINEDGVLNHIIVGLFEALNISSMDWTSWFLLVKCQLTNKIIIYIKNNDTNFNTLTIVCCFNLYCVFAHHYNFLRLSTRPIWPCDVQGMSLCHKWQ